MFNRELKAEIVRRGFNNEMIGKAIGCSKEYFSRKLHNNAFSLEDATKISNVLGLSMQRRAEIFLPVALHQCNEVKDHE